MDLCSGQTVLLTGATGGLGSHMAVALAGRGLNLSLVAYPGSELDSTVWNAIRKGGVQAITIPADLSKPAERQRVIEITRKQFGRVDILVNNAGVEFSAFYHELSEEQIEEVLSVNLEAPMMLSWAVLPDMLRQGRGHIVNISSLAAHTRPAFQECYSATKAALIGFTSSLRATYRGSGVSASVICPGFVEAGIYARLKAKAGQPAPRLIGAVPPGRVAAAVIKAIERDAAEVIVNRYPVRPLLALFAMSPKAQAWIPAKLGLNDFFKKVVSPKQE